MNDKQERILYLDVIRVVAMIAVIMIHCAAENWYKLDGREFQWQVFNAYDSMVRFAVPLFVMLTGATMGNPAKKLDIGTLWKKNILRLAIAYVTWHLFYIFTDRSLCHQLMEAFPESVITVENILCTTRSHLWFLFMILCIYVCIPLLRLVTSSKQGLIYAIRIAILFSFIIPTILEFPFFTDQPHLNVILTFIKSKFYTATAYHLNFEYIAYFFIGYYLSTMKVDRKMAIKYLCIAFTGWAATFGISAAYAWHTHASYGFYENYTLPILAEAVGVFVVIKYIVSQHALGHRAIQIITVFSKYSFGIYLIHVFVIDQLTEFGLSSVTFNPILATPLKVVVTLLISLLASVVLHHIPILKKCV